MVLSLGNALEAVELASVVMCAMLFGATSASSRKSISPLKAVPVLVVPWTTIFNSCDVFIRVAVRPELELLVASVNELSESRTGTMTGAPIPTDVGGVIGEIPESICRGSRASNRALRPG